MKQRDFSAQFAKYRRKFAEEKQAAQGAFNWMNPGDYRFDEAVSALKKLLSGTTVVLTRNAGAAAAVHVLARVIGLHLDQTGMLFWLPMRKK